MSANGRQPTGEDYRRLTMEDLICRQPSVGLDDSKAWRELQDMVGLEHIKGLARSVADLVQQNYKRELEERPLIHVLLNRFLVGNPGTGKVKPLLCLPGLIYRLNARICSVRSSATSVS